MVVFKWLIYVFSHLILSLKNTLILMQKYSVMEITEIVLISNFSLHIYLKEKEQLIFVLMHFSFYVACHVNIISSLLCYWLCLLLYTYGERFYCWVVIPLKDICSWILYHHFSSNKIFKNMLCFSFLTTFIKTSGIHIRVTSHLDKSIWEKNQRNL